MSQAKMEIDNSVRYVHRQKDAQSTHNGEKNHDTFKKTHQSKHSLNQNKKNFSNKVTDRRFRVLEWH